ncbi:unnamed protein product, partial [Ascophyllum nodosum]
MRIAGVAAAIAVAAGWQQANAESVASRLQISIPAVLHLENGYAHEEALFGIPKYGGSIAERLIHGGVAKGSQKTWTLCSSDDVVAFETIMPEDSPFILMVDRGNCTFVSKVRRAQYLGAAGVIIADNTCL